MDSGRQESRDHSLTTSHPIRHAFAEGRRAATRVGRRITDLTAKEVSDDGHAGPSNSPVAQPMASPATIVSSATDLRPPGFRGCGSRLDREGPDLRRPPDCATRTTGGRRPAASPLDAGYRNAGNSSTSQGLHQMIALDETRECADVDGTVLQPRDDADAARAGVLVLLGAAITAFRSRARVA